jgi:hypothetical protein
MTIKERESGGPFWSEVDEIFAGIDDSWYGLRIDNHSQCNY